MAIRQVNGIILRRREVTETSLILTVFSDIAGKLILIAKGARRKKSHFKGRVELFSLCRLTYYENPRRGLNILSESEIVNPLEALRTDYESFLTACYMAELVDICTGIEQRSRSTYNLLRAAMLSIPMAADKRLLERFFELHLMGLTGYKLELTECVSCSLKGKGIRYFSSREGGILCRRCAASRKGLTSVSPSAIGALRYLRDSSIGSASSLKPSMRQAGEMEAVMKAAIEYYFEYQPKSLAVR